jgi:hypothetical protein
VDRSAAGFGCTYWRAQVDMFAYLAPSEVDTLEVGAQLRAYAKGEQRNCVILLTISTHLTTWRRSARKHKRERPEPMRASLPTAVPRGRRLRGGFRDRSAAPEPIRR